MNEIEREFELERMVLFSDAVFAIAITLLVIDIKWPDLPLGATRSQIYKALLPTIYQFFAFVLSFFFVGRAWTLNLSLFRLLKRYDMGLIKRNLFFLFFVVTFPFTASGMSGHLRDNFELPIFIYIGNITLVNVMHYLMSNYIFEKKPALSVPGEEAEKKFILTRSKYNAFGLSSLFFIILIFSFFVPFEICAQLMSPLFVLHIVLVKRIVRKYRPVPVPVPQ
jgi:uncharacterized membrane protein